MDWRAIKDADVTNDVDRINDIAVAGERRWAVSSDGRVFRWQGTSPVSAAPLPDAQHARSIAFDGGGNVGWIGLLRAPTDQLPRLLKTTNGGESWKPVPDLPTHPAEGICGISVIQPELAWACGTYKNTASPGAWRTTDGNRWSALPLPAAVTGLTDIEFWTARDGIMIGQQTRDGITSPIILLTESAGDTWREAKIEGSFVDGAHCWKVHRSNEGVAYVTIAASRETGVVLKSSDGCQSWSPLEVTDEAGQIDFWHLQGIGFLDREHGWVGQRGGPTFETFDGGASWQAADQLLTNVNRLAFTAEGVYAAGAALYLRA